MRLLVLGEIDGDQRFLAAEQRIGQGGILTEAVRKRPYSVVLLDEVEKAHRDVMNLFYQVFDRGVMRDGEGREIDFRNTVILMTANLGSDLLMQLLDEQPEASESDL
ncbi:AAA family ATPase, partial [Klebsiella pneumoniae]|uniref:AAA family ATPase n=1 Tax=Klebsiella pneumoniae TaxID=573 RepID=UPI003DA92682